MNKSFAKLYVTLEKVSVKRYVRQFGNITAELVYNSNSHILQANDEREFT
jgi:hypothetical protein